MIENGAEEKTNAAAVKQLMTNQRNKENFVDFLQDGRSEALDRSVRSVPGSAGFLMTNPNFSKTAVGFLYKKHAMEVAKEVSLRSTIQNNGSDLNKNLGLQ